MSDIFNFIINLPLTYKIIIGILILGVILAAAKKLVKFAIYLAIFVILLIVILKLLDIPVETPGIQKYIPGKIKI
jgi:hypothetical protein